MGSFRIPFFFEDGCFEVFFIFVSLGFSFFSSWLLIFWDSSGFLHACFEWVSRCFDSSLSFQRV